MKDGYTSVHITAGKVIAKYIGMFLRYWNLYIEDVIDWQDIVKRLNELGLDEDGNVMPVNRLQNTFAQTNAGTTNFDKIENN